MTRCARCACDLEGSTVEHLRWTDGPGCRPCEILERIQAAGRAVEEIAQLGGPPESAHAAWLAADGLLGQLRREAPGTAQYREGSESVRLMEDACEGMVCSPCGGEGRAPGIVCGYCKGRGVVGRMGGGRAA